MEEREIEFILDLTRVITRTRTIADLFRASFSALSRVVRLDLAVAVLLDQTLDVYLSRREGLEEPLTDRFGSEVRGIITTALDVKFGETDLVIRTDFPDFPAAPKADAYAHSIDMLIEHEGRIMGVLILFNQEPFPREASLLLDAVTAQISMVIAGIRSTERIQNMADTDELTGIWNRRWLRRQLPSEIDRSRVYHIPLSLAMFDVDDFKKVNDTWGHLIGDVLLSELCGTVRETLRPPDTLARFGGDEFAVVLPHSDLYGARAVADRILQRARALRITGADGVSEVRCSVSIGLATWVPPTMTAAELLQRADERLYESKRLGKNRVSW